HRSPPWLSSRALIRAAGGFSGGRPRPVSPPPPPPPAGAAAAARAGGAGAPSPVRPPPAADPDPPVRRAPVIALPWMKFMSDRSAGGGTSPSGLAPLCE